jgi:hypothetical protein
MTFESTMSPLTALEAVNNMLLSIGQGAINSIESSESVDAENAKTILHSTSRQVQNRGWYFNRERDYPLIPNTEGAIELPDNCLQFAPDARFRHVVERGRALFDTKNHTATFDAGTRITGTVVFFLPFEELPQSARDYIAARAGRLFQIGRISSELLYKFTREMEAEALTELNRAHLRAERPNIYMDDPRAYRIARERRE